MSALTWGHNDKRLFLATGTQIHIAWISRRIATLQLLSRLKIYDSIECESQLQKLPLPVRIRNLIGNLFVQTIRVLPKVRISSTVFPTYFVLVFCARNKFVEGIRFETSVGFRTTSLYHDKARRGQQFIFWDVLHFVLGIPGWSCPTFERKTDEQNKAGICDFRSAG